jgi:uncharacterized membrane protein (DUF4010 family)
VSERFVELGLALGLGLLIGFQRERVKTRESPGVRTFPLIAIAGALAAMAAETSAAVWLPAAGLVALAALLVAHGVAGPRDDGAGMSFTTAVAAVVTYLLGALLVLVSIEAGVVVGGLVAVLLHFKQPMHRLTGRLSDADVSAVMRIALIGLVVLPVLPDRTYGPYDVLNPFRIWLVVVLIVGISLVSHVLYRLVDARAGTVLAGVLGGLVSSTATTASYARRSRAHPKVAGSAAAVVMIASTAVVARILVEVGVVARDALPHVAAPLLAMGAVNVVLCALGLWLFGRGGRVEMAEDEDPSELRAALVFGVLYGAVIFLVAAAKQHFGDAGLYAVAAVSGLTDVDAITISTARLVEEGRIASTPGWRAMLIATLANLVFKAGIAGALGGRRLLAPLGALFGASFAAGVAILLFWPAA